MKIGRVENLSFFESAIFIFLQFFYFFLFASSLLKSINIRNIARMGQNFDDYPDLQQKSKCA